MGSCFAVEEKFESVFKHLPDHQLIYPNGDSYIGDINAEGKREGHGVYIFANGDLYQGQWLSDKKHGEGTFKYSNGESYHGQW